MSTVRHSVQIAAPRERAFEVVNDYRQVPKWMFGVSRFAPLTDVTVGLGATFDAAIKLGPKTLHAVVEVTEWVENEIIVLDSIKGFDASGTWRFAELDSPDHVDLDVRFDYNLPGGFAGRALGAVIEPFIGQGIAHTESSLTRLITSDRAA